MRTVRASFNIGTGMRYIDVILSTKKIPNNQKSFTGDKNQKSIYVVSQWEVGHEDLLLLKTP